jgi:hypothetical protein
MLYGPTDWTTSAAIVALSWRALAEPALRAEIEPMFGWMRSQIPAQGFTCWEIVLCDCWLALGGHAEPFARELRSWQERYDRTIGERNVVRPPVRRYGGLTLEQYAEFCLERDRLLGPVGYAGPRAAIQAFVGGQVPPGLAQLCQRFGVPLRDPETGHIHPFISEWQEAINASGRLQEAFIEAQRTITLSRQGVSGKEKAALDQILDGNMDMHMRMAQAQQAQRDLGDGKDADPDPVVFPGQRVARLSDYVGMMKRMQTGDMNGALAAYGLDMMSYMAVAQAWGAKMAADPMLTEKFSRMMMAR